MQICPSCGEENPDRFRLCGICGASLVPETVAQEIRRTVSIVFTDLKGSTSLGERLDNESLREVLSVYFNEMRTLPDLGRAERIGEFWSYPQSRTFAELPIDCEEDRTLRAVLVACIHSDT